MGYRDVSARMRTMDQRLKFLEVQQRPPQAGHDETLTTCVECGLGRGLCGQHTGRARET